MSSEYDKLLDTLVGPDSLLHGLRFEGAEFRRASQVSAKPKGLARAKVLDFGKKRRAKRRQSKASRKKNRKKK